MSLRMRVVLDLIVIRGEAAIFVHRWRPGAAQKSRCHRNSTVCIQMYAWDPWTRLNGPENRAEYNCHILSVPDLASQEWPLKQCFNPGTLVAHWKARFTSLPVTVRCWQFHILQKYPPVTPLWTNSTTVRRPLDKMKPKDWFRQFFPFYYFLFVFSFFGLKLRGIRHLATRLQNTLQWPHSGPTVQPLGDPWAKWSQRTGLDNFSFLFYFSFLFSFLDSSCEE